MKLKWMRKVITDWRSCAAVKSNLMLFDLGLICTGSAGLGCLRLCPGNSTAYLHNPAVIFFRSACICVWISSFLSFSDIHEFSLCFKENLREEFLNVFQKPLDQSGTLKGFTRQGYLYLMEKSKYTFFSSIL